VKYPLLYQLNTRVLVTEAGAAATLDGLPDSLLDGAQAKGFDWIWMLGVWQTGAAGRRQALAAPLRAGYARELPDVRDEDIVGSPFAVTGYDAHRDFGGDAALARLRQRLRARGMRLMLDFIPNHVALDHPWAAAHPEYFVGGTPDDLAREPQNFTQVATPRGPVVLAHGRDPGFPGWTDTLQLNYHHPALREAMLAELLRVAARCDGVRCDMAMLLEPDVIARTWGGRARPTDGTAPADAPFWPEAIARVRREHPEFLFVAEVYWDLEWRLQQHGFDFTYDKRLYDRLRDGASGPVRDHLAAEPAFSDRCARFLENHDEARAAATFPPDRHHAAAALTYLVPGLRLFHEGQLEGRRGRTPVQLARRAPEPPDPTVRALYEDLLALLARRELRDGAWRLLPRVQEAPDVIAFVWTLGARRLTVAVNAGPHAARWCPETEDRGSPLDLSPWSYRIIGAPDGM
jgi:glycosidase